MKSGFLGENRGSVLVFFLFRGSNTILKLIIDTALIVLLQNCAIGTLEVVRTLVLVSVAVEPAQEQATFTLDALGQCQLLK